MRCDLQQVAHAVLHGEYACSGEIGVELPRNHVNAMLHRSSDDLDLLALASERQSRVVVLGGRLGASSLLLIANGLTRYGEVTTIHVAVVPLGLEHVAVGRQHATDDGEDDQEDARSGVGPSRIRRPLVGKERCVVGVGEGHGHRVARHGRVHVHIHVHVHGGCVDVALV